MIIMYDPRSPPRLHLLPRHQCRFDRREIHPLAVHVRLHAADELPCQQRIPSRAAHFDQRLSLPIVRCFRIVTQRMTQADRQLTFISLRTKPQVNAKSRSFLRDPRQYLGNLLGEADEILLVRQGSLCRLLAVAVQKKQVHVGAVIQFVAPQLA